MIPKIREILLDVVIDDEEKSYLSRVLLPIQYAILGGIGISLVAAWSARVFSLIASA